MEAPSDRCGFTYAGGKRSACCCYRETEPGTERCIWHAKESGKRPDRIRSALQNDDVGGEAIPIRERLDGAELENADLSQLDLRGASLADANIEGADLSSSDLRGVDLGGATLRDAVVADTNLRGADLRNADLYDAELVDSDLRDARLEESDLGDVDLRDTKLNHARLRGVSLRDADCTGTTFRGADLTGADMEGAFLNRSDLSGATLTDARLYGTVLTGARANDGTSLDDRCVYDPVRNEVVESNGSEPSATVRAIGTYQELEALCSENALLDQFSEYFVRRQDIYTRRHREDRRWGRWLRARVSRIVVLYGESPFRVLGAAAAIILASTLLYPLGNLRSTTTGELLTFPPPTRPIEVVRTLLDSFYFSTLTFTTMTYGEFVPVDAGRFLVMIETASGVVLIALLVFVFGRRATR